MKTTEERHAEIAEAFAKGLAAFATSTIHQNPYSGEDRIAWRAWRDGFSAAFESHKAMEVDD